MVVSAVRSFRSVLKRVGTADAVNGMASKEQVSSGTETSSSTIQYTLLCPREQTCYSPRSTYALLPLPLHEADLLDTATQNDGSAIGTLAFLSLTTSSPYGDNSFRTFMPK